MGSQSCLAVLTDPSRGRKFGYFHLTDSSRQQMSGSDAATQMNAGWSIYYQNLFSFFLHTKVIVAWGLSSHLRHVGKVTDIDRIRTYGQ